MRLKPYSAVIILLLFFGCATHRPVSKPPITEHYPSPEPPIRKEAPIQKKPFQTVTERFRLKALESENSEELPKALFYWKVVHCFSSQDREVLKKIEALETRIHMEAEKHFEKGVGHFQKKSIQEARREFLLALANNPDHRQSLYYLKHHLNETDILLYDVKEGDTLRSISQKLYKDPEKEFLISYFNDLSQDNPLRPGMALKFPVLTQPRMTKPVYSEERINKPDLLLQSREPEVSLQEQAEFHYLKGIRHFLDEELDKAIEEWEETFRLNPDHPRAKKDLQKARQMLEDLRKIE